MALSNTDLSAAYRKATDAHVMILANHLNHGTPIDEVEVASIIDERKRLWLLMEARPGMVKKPLWKRLFRK